jgi:hypothetical protein
MSFGTSLSDAYGSMSPYETPQLSSPQMQMPSQLQSQGQGQNQNVKPTQQNTKSQNFKSRPIPSQIVKREAYIDSEEKDKSRYLGQMESKRREMIKIVTYSLMILLALVTYTATDVVVKEIVASYDFSFKQELMLRLAYPVLIFFLIWNVKVFV